MQGASACCYAFGQLVGKVVMNAVAGSWKTFASFKKVLVAFAAAQLTHGAPADAADYRVIYKFAGGNNGMYPQAGVIVGANGALYGTTTAGGAAGFGTIFRLSPPVPPDTRWTRTTLHVFTGGNGGGTPSYGGLISDANGALYGMTTYGGTASLGTVYKLTPPVPPSTKWIRTVLYSFRGGSDGLYPFGGLAFGPDGALYGATSQGGGAAACSCGVVFKLSPPIAPAVRWTETVIYRFQGGSDGYQPAAVTPVFDADGALYGTTKDGGAHNYGTVFRLTPPTPPATQWTETIIHSFAGQRSGGWPYSGVVLDGAGALYGTTPHGGYWGTGTVYKLAPPTPPATQWTLTILREHRHASDGEIPYAPMVFGPDGALYGATESGSVYSFGAVYKLTPPTPPATSWTISGLHAFRGGADGSHPAYGGLVFDAGGALYGATSLGGPADAGTIYQIK